jgi:hypothetical protein
LKPKIPTESPEVFSNLMSRCWSHEPKERPRFVEVIEQLRVWSNLSGLAVRPPLHRMDRGPVDARAAEELTIGA